MSRHELIMQPLRILCIGPHRAPSNALMRARALEEMGHEVVTFDPAMLPILRQRLINKLMRVLFPAFKRLIVGRALLGKTANFQPDLLFVEKGQWMTAMIIRQIREACHSKPKIVHYNPDDPFGEYGQAGWESFLEAIPSYDVHFVPREENVTEYQSRGAKKVCVYDRSFDTEMHRPVALSSFDQKKYACDVGFIGTLAPHRESVIAELIRKGIDVCVWGSGWDRGKEWPTIAPHWRGGTQVNEDYVKAICGMKIALHFLRRENRDEQDSRSFEIPACGTFMLAERTATHERLFEDKLEAVFFDKTADLIEKLAFYLENDEVRCQIAVKGRERCLNSEYSNEARLRGFLQQIF